MGNNVSNDIFEIDESNLNKNSLYDLQIYKWRSDASLNKFISRVIPTINMDDNQARRSLLCSYGRTEKSVNIVFQQYICGIGKFQNQLSFEQIICVLLSILKGQQVVFKRFNLALVHKQCIFVTKNGQIQVWINPNFYINQFWNNSKHEFCLRALIQRRQSKQNQRLTFLNREQIQFHQNYFCDSPYKIVEKVIKLVKPLLMNQCLLSQQFWFELQKNFSSKKKDYNLENVYIFVQNFKLYHNIRTINNIDLNLSNNSNILTKSSLKRSKIGLNEQILNNTIIQDLQNISQTQIYNSKNLFGQNKRFRNKQKTRRRNTSSTDDNFRINKSKIIQQINKPYFQESIQNSKILNSQYQNKKNNHHLKQFNKNIDRILKQKLNQSLKSQQNNDIQFSKNRNSNFQIQLNRQIKQNQQLKQLKRKLKMKVDYQYSINIKQSQQNQRVIIEYQQQNKFLQKTIIKNPILKKKTIIAGSRQAYQGGNIRKHKKNATLNLSFNQIVNTANQKASNHKKQSNQNIIQQDKSCYYSQSQTIVQKSQKNYFLIGDTRRIKQSQKNVIKQRPIQKAQLKRPSKVSIQLQTHTMTQSHIYQNNSKDDYDRHLISQSKKRISMNNDNDAVSHAPRISRLTDFSNKFMTSIGSIQSSICNSNQSPYSGILTHMGNISTRRVSQQFQSIQASDPSQSSNQQINPHKIMQLQKEKSNGNGLIPYYMA